MRPTRSLGHVAGLAASLCIVGIALEVWDGSPARTAGVELLVWCALGYGAVAIAVGVGSFLGRPDEVWSASLAALTAVLPLLAAVPVTPGIRILGPAVGALTVVPLVLTTTRLVAANVGSGVACATSLTRMAAVSGLCRATIGASTAVFVIMIVAREPFLEPACLSYCGHNPWLVAAAPQLVAASQITLGVLTSMWCVAVCWALSAGHTHRPELSTRLLVLAAAFAATGSLGRGLEVAGEHPVVAVGGQLVMLTGIQAATLVSQLNGARVRRQVRLLSSDLAARGRLGQVDRWLRETVRDDSLRVTFPGAAGREAPEAATMVRRGGVTIATVEHRARSSQRVDRAITPVVAMAIDNDRLHALALTQFDSLVDSRRRIVHTGDAARQRLERDLHDGAQQRLLLLGMTLADESERAVAVDKVICREGVALAARALSELRAIGTGVVPVILEQLGLVEAIRAFTEGAPISVELIIDRWSGSQVAHDVERAAYRVVTSTVHQAARCGATSATVRVAKDQVLTIAITHAGSPSADHTDDEDRVGAVRGLWSVSLEGGHVLARAVLPCG